MEFLQIKLVLPLIALGFFKPSEVAELISFTIKLAKTVMETQPNYFR